MTNNSDSSFSIEIIYLGLCSKEIKALCSHWYVMACETWPTNTVVYSTALAKSSMLIWGGLSGDLTLSTPTQGFANGPIMFRTFC